MTVAPIPRDAFAPPLGAITALSEQPRQTCAVRLFDRRTGRPHRVNGQALVLFSRHPEQAAAELLQGRDASVWEVRIEPMGG